MSPAWLCSVLWCMPPRTCVAITFHFASFTIAVTRCDVRHHDSKLVNVCHFLTVLDSSWQLLACDPFHCFSTCLSVPMHFLAVLGIPQLLLASSCEWMPIASSVFHCLRRFLCMICPRIMCVCCTECASMHITCHAYANCMFRRVLRVQ